MAKKSLWRVLAVMSAAAFALAIAASVFAQAPPSPPHQFYGAATTGSGAQLDGEAAADGAEVTAWNADGVAVATATVSGGVWELQVQPDDAESVVFTINGSLPSASFDVQSGSFTEVSLDLSSPPAEEEPADAADDDADAADDDADAADDDADAAGVGMPETGSGGLAGGGSSLPILPLIFAISVLVGVGGVMAMRRIRA